MHVAIIRIWTSFEKFVGSLKFAVIIITLFALGMAAGTLMESYYGTDFANRAVYKGLPFMAIQFFMFLSILFATFHRLPPKKRLYGFYSIHTGLILIGCGSLVTYLSGIDASLHLPPMTPTRDIVLQEDILQITLPREGRRITYPLPYRPFSTQLEEEYTPLDIKLVRYLPFSQKVFSLEESGKTYAPGENIDSSQYRIQNPNISQDFWLTHHPEARDFEGHLRLGPLSISYLPSHFADCFALDNPGQIIIWNQLRQSCTTPEAKGAKLEKTQSGKLFLVFREEGELYRFFPELSPLPLDENFKSRSNSPVKVFYKKPFASKPHLLLFGHKAAFYLVDEKKWEVHSLVKGGQGVDLPWMGFELSLLQHEKKRIPTLTPEYVPPLQLQGKIVRGGEQAVLLNIKGKSIWVTDQTPVRLTLDEREILFQVGKKTAKLPFEFVLDRFKMETDPGTNRPASFESFVRVLSDDGYQKHHIFMNNPLKRDGLTFYQASYSQDEEGNYSSTLSVNLDPGRPVKYLGCLFLVFGAIGHYNLNRKKIKKPQRIDSPWT